MLLFPTLLSTLVQSISHPNGNLSESTPLVWYGQYYPTSNFIGSGDWVIWFNSLANNGNSSNGRAIYNTTKVFLAGPDQKLHPPPAPLRKSINATGAIFNLLHWLYLADFGQTSETLYPYYSANNLANSSQLPSSHNVFVNSSIYSKMTNWLGSLHVQIPLFEEINPRLPLKANNTTLLMSYSCRQRRLKSPLTLIITVAVADYALVKAGYEILLIIAIFLENRAKRDIFHCTASTN